MIENIKEQLWKLLKQKEVSLAMVFHKEGEILWHKGRKIKGNDIQNGGGFSKTFIGKALENNRNVDEKNVAISSIDYGLPESAMILHIKSLLILPIDDQFFLYVDSGTKDSFRNSDKETFKILGNLLGELIRKIRKNSSDTGGLSGTSREIENVRELILKFSLEEEPVLLLGETGVGKSHVAELIHRFSGRKGRFFTINTPSISETLFESEVFGHKKGSFTDAKKDKKGYVDEAEEGTLFFDEIMEIPFSFQAKLLRFIETQKYVVIGESKERQANVRIVAATNAPLEKSIDTEKIREDLYYRLHVLEIDIPPLRNRKEDIKALVEENTKLLKGKKIGNGFWTALQDYHWPGNVRELLTVLTRAGILLDCPITGDNLKSIIYKSSRLGDSNPQTEKIDRILEHIKTGGNYWDVIWKPFINRDLDRETVKKVLGHFFNQGNFNFKNMIESLNLSEKDYKKFISLMHQYNISPKAK